MRIVQLLSVVAVLAVGACAAWPFRREKPRLAVPPPDHTALDLTLRRAEVPADVLPLHAVSPAVGLEAGPAQYAPMSFHTQRQERIVDLENLAPPPDLPLAFEPAIDDANIAMRHDVQRPMLPQPQPLASLAPVPRTRTYRLRDGDTLEQLAERFLGSRERATEIFEANRDVLTSPDLLPVGCTLTIPARDEAGG